MNLPAIRKRRGLPVGLPPGRPWLLHTSVLLLLLLLLRLPASGQPVTLSVKSQPVEAVFRALERQTPFRFVYHADDLKGARPLTLEVRQVPFREVLQLCVEGQPFTYSLSDGLVIIRARDPKESPVPVNLPARSLSGRVLSESRQPLAGATVTLQPSGMATATDDAGRFFFPFTGKDHSLVVSSVGYLSRQEALSATGVQEVVLTAAASQLDETVVIAYGTTTRRLNTGNVSRVTAEQISRQPLSNPLAALEGRVPGLLVTPSSGLPGAGLQLQIRGRNSLAQGSQPLYIVDGVPFMLNSLSLAQSASSASVQTPFTSLNPADIESIEVLKDADATAIYGSQGANGVVLITTKKGRTGKTSVQASFSQGWGRVSRLVPVLDRTQYLQMRREAFANDGVVPTVSTAPDLLVWDTARSTNWQQELLGGTARQTTANASLSGGSASTQFLFSAGYYRETTVFPGGQPFQRGSNRLGITHTGANQKFRAGLSASYSLERKDFPYNDLSRYTFLPPTAPPGYDSAGRLNWVNQFDNPFSQLLRTYSSESRTLVLDAALGYQLTKHLMLKADLGYSTMQLEEALQVPIRAQRPSATITGTSELAGNGLKTWILEPQVEYRGNWGDHHLQWLAGGSAQQRDGAGFRVTGSGYTSDDLLGSLSAAGLLTVSNSSSRYRYSALFTRLRYQWKGEWVFTGNLRRDGSSRFGPASRMATFGAVGGAWVFSQQPAVVKRLPWLSFGKFRASYGVTGNDQIGDYQFYDTWSSAPAYQYGTQAGILPSQLFNPEFRWERNRKWEGAVELGFLKDRLLVSAAYYRNRSDNQLVFQSLPSQTGFGFLLKNLDAQVENTGWELELTVKGKPGTRVQWSTGLQLTVPRSRLLAYPGLDQSGDRFTYALGHPLDVLFGYRFGGVDPATGLYSFGDRNGDGRITSPEDLALLGALTQQLYGGWTGQVNFKGFTLDVLLDFRAQEGRSYLTGLAGRPGSLSNQPRYVLERWQKPGDITEIQRYTTATGNPALTAYNQLRVSSAQMTDASFLRLRQVHLAYHLPRWRVQGARVFVQGQNLFTLTGYRGADPLTQNLLALPTIRFVTAGIQLTF